MAANRKIDLVILGLLAHEDLTGYDIKKRIDNGIGFFWKGSFGSIYPALSDMERRGWVESSPGSGSGKRERIVYRITTQGYEILKAWLRDEQASNELKYETLLKLFFGNVEEPEVSIRNIEAFEKTVARDFEILKTYRDNLEKAPDQKSHVYYYLTVMFGIETYEAYLRWCKQAKELLDGMERGT